MGLRRVTRQRNVQPRRERARRPSPAGSSASAIPAFQSLSPKVSRIAGLVIPAPSSVRLTRVVSPSCSMVAATRLAPPRREFCSVSVKISARPAENSRVTLSMALSPTRAWIAAGPLPGSAVTAFCSVDIGKLLVVDTGMKNAPPERGRRGVLEGDEREGSASAQEGRDFQIVRVVAVAADRRQGRIGVRRRFVVPVAAEALRPRQ